MRSIGTVIAAAAVLAGCAGDPNTGTGPRENTGTLVGALAGAAIGSQFGGGTGERIAAGVAGAAIGGLIGNRIGAGMDDEDKRRAYYAQVEALDRGASGAPVGWENPDSGRRGTIVPGPQYDRRGEQCRSSAQGRGRSRSAVSVWPAPGAARPGGVRRSRRGSCAGSGRGRVPSASPFEG